MHQARHDTFFNVEVTHVLENQGLAFSRIRKQHALEIQMTAHCYKT